MRIYIYTYSYPNKLLNFNKILTLLVIFGGFIGIEVRKYFIRINIFVGIFKFHKLKINYTLF